MSAVSGKILSGHIPDTFYANAKDIMTRVRVTPTSIKILIPMPLRVDKSSTLSPMGSSFFKNSKREQFGGSAQLTP